MKQTGVASLLVEDDPDMAEMFRLVLSFAGHDVESWATVARLRAGEPENDVSSFWMSAARDRRARHARPPSGEPVDPRSAGGDADELWRRNAPSEGPLPPNLDWWSRVRPPPASSPGG